ncbi:DNA glycosylase AlkZ-like family protein [Pseudoroseomonas wenyumeiae]
MPADHDHRHHIGAAPRLGAPRDAVSLTTLGDALQRLGFVQADPIRAPARAQDLILRHRVQGYRAGDLDRAFHAWGWRRISSTPMASCQAGRATCCTRAPTWKAPPASMPPRALPPRCWISCGSAAPPTRATWRSASAGNAR